MVDLDNLKNQKKGIKKKLKRELKSLSDATHKIEKMNEVIANADSIIETLDYKFETTVKIQKENLPFLWIAVALQTVRQYMLSFPERTAHNVADKEAHAIEDKIFSNERFTDTSGYKQRYYYNPLNNIISKGVPYDTLKNSKQFNLGGGINSNRGFTPDSHRIKTLGHDPLLGYVFGTANILTSTLTTTSGVTVHVKNGEICAKASTKKMFEYASNRINQDKKSAIAAFIKQYLHIKSDEYSIDGLALPGVPLTSEELTSWLMDIGIDYANTKIMGKQMVYAQLINFVILALYSLINYKAEEPSIIQVKGAKIIEYSNVISSTSNLIYSCLTSDVKKLDIGGMVTTVYSIVTSKKIQYELKKEFIEKELNTYLDSM